MAYLNAETLLIDWFVHGEGREGLPLAPASLLGVHFSTDVPENRPERLVTFERVGGAADRFTDNPQVAVQAWAGTRWEAEQLCNAVRVDLNMAFRYHPAVTNVEIGSMVNFPDEFDNQRFQVLVTFRTSAY